MKTLLHSILLSAGFTLGVSAAAPLNLTLDFTARLLTMPTSTLARERGISRESIGRIKGGFICSTISHFRG